MGTTKRIGPLELTGSYTTNIYNQGSALIYDEIRKIHVANITSSAKTFRLFLGATGANVQGTEQFYDQEVPPNDFFEYHCKLKLMSTEFLVGGASAVDSLVITIETEQTVV